MSANPVRALIEAAKVCYILDERSVRQHGIDQHEIRVLRNAVKDAEDWLAREEGQWLECEFCGTRINTDDVAFCSDCEKTLQQAIKDAEGVGLDAGRAEGKKIVEAWIAEECGIRGHDSRKFIGLHEMLKALGKE